MQTKYIFLILSLLAILQSCVDPVELDEGSNESLLVIDGQIDLSENGGFVRITRTADLGSSIAEPVENAQVTIYDNLGNNISYAEVSEGLYEIPFSLFPVEVGRSYFLEIITPDGSRYQTRPEVLPPPSPIQDVYAEYSNRSAQIFVETTRPDANTPIFFKWDIDVVYQVSEIVCFGLDPVFTCYITDFDYTQQVLTFDASQTAVGSTIKQQVADKFVDFSFGEKQVFSVYQTTLSQDAYRYFTDVNTITNNSGNFFDIQPAAVRGNVFNTEDENELVLGYFRAVTRDTMRLSLTRGDLGDNVVDQALPFCGIAGFPPFPRPQACCNCTVLENSTLEQPDYWIE